MPPTTRASARRASGALPPPRSVPSPNGSIRAPRGPSLVLGDATDSSSSLVPAAEASHQPASTANGTPNLSQDPEYPILGDELDLNESAGAVTKTIDTLRPTGSSGHSPATVRVLRASKDSGSSLAATSSSSQPSITSSGASHPLNHRRLESVVDSDNSRLGAMSTVSLASDSVHPISTSIKQRTDVECLDDIEDLVLRQHVSNLQESHQWATTSLCYSMLVRCRFFADADGALRKMVGKEIPHNIESSNASERMTAHSVSSVFKGTGQLQNPKVENSSKPKSGSSTKISNKNGQVTIESGQQLLSFSKSVALSQGIFSRSERQKAIATSTETAADRERNSFIANAVLYKAFSVQSASDYGRASKKFVPQYGMKVFQAQPGLQPPDLVPPTLMFRGTDRGKFQPLSLNTAEDGRVVLQSINLAFPYLKTSFEELRFGDYIRGRKKAPHLFDIFRKLPPEVRCMIWRFAMPSRTIELRHNPPITKTWTPAKVPALLQVCQESRYEALKRYTLAFGIGNAQSNIYFDFNRDVLFLTYEKWHGEAEYEGEASELTASFVLSGEAKKIRHLAIDKDLLDILAGMLEDEEEEWYDEGDDNVPKPEMEILPFYKSLESLSIVKTTIDGFWYPDEVGCEGDHDGKECDIHKRARNNDKAVIVQIPAHNVAHANREYHKQMVAQIKELYGDDYSVPVIEYMEKRASLKKTPRHRRSGCTCGHCYSDSD